MEERMELVIIRAVQLGKESAAQDLSREKFRWQKHLGEMKEQVSPIAQHRFGCSCMTTEFTI